MPFSVLNITRLRLFKIYSRVKIHLSQNCPNQKPVFSWWEADHKKAEKGREGQCGILQTPPHCRDACSGFPSPARWSSDFSSNLRGTRKWSLRAWNPAKSSQGTPKPTNKMEHFFVTFCGADYSLCPFPPPPRPK